MRKILPVLQLKDCLLKSYPRLYGQCQDGILDPGEECDCGYPELCNKTSVIKNCCNHKVCKFNPKINCSLTNCCQNCQFADNQICRPVKGDCDSPEYCKDGKLKCPRDNYLPNYQLCNSNKGYCYNGECVDMDKMCQIAYNSRNTYFSLPCAKFVQNLIVERCENLAFNDDPAFIHELCGSNGSLCNYFFCGVQRNYSNKEMHLLRTGNETCIYPKPNSSKNLLSTAPLFMPCFDNSSSHNMSCLQNKCINKDILNLIFQNISEFNHFLNTSTFEYKSSLDEKKSNLENLQYSSASQNNNLKYNKSKILFLFVLSISGISFLVKLFNKFKSYIKEFY